MPHHKINEGTLSLAGGMVRDIDKEVKQYGSLSKIPAAAVGNTRNDMYLASEAIRLLVKDKGAELSANDIASLE